MNRSRILNLFLALVFLLPACGQEDKTGALTAGVDALIIKSKEFPLYDQAIDGFKSVFGGNQKILTMPGPADEEKFHAEILETNPRVILAVGLRAARWIRDQGLKTPTVFCMAMHPEDNQLKTDSMTGVHLEPAPGEQLQAFARVLPEAVKIGLIYDPQRTGRQVERIKSAANKLGLSVFARPVENRDEVPAALLEVAAESQALWLIRDATVLTREFFNHTLFLQLSKRLPLIAYSEQFVRKGAFFSYSTRYDQQGETAGDIANRILQGTNPADIPLQHPRGGLCINARTGQMIGALLPSIRSQMPPEEVYRIE